MSVVVLGPQAKSQVLPLPDAPVPQITLKVPVDNFAIKVVQPKFKVYHWHFYVSEFINWGGVAADAAFSSRFVGSCATEGNPMFAKNNGFGFNTGKYLAINLPIAFSITTIHIIQRKKYNHEGVNWFTDATAIGNGTPHIVESIRWARLCM